MVSDGGMVNGYGSYGWIIANDDKLTRGRGEAEGAEELMQSFRAEGYGMLAALRYILHAFTYTDNWSATNKPIHMYCDNLALVQRIGWHEKRIVTTPKDVMRADYDLEAAIKNTIDTLRKKRYSLKKCMSKDTRTDTPIIPTYRERSNSMLTQITRGQTRYGNIQNQMNTTKCPPHDQCCTITENRSQAKKQKHSARHMDR
jgi:hypothetical protein